MQFLFYTHLEEANHHNLNRVSSSRTSDFILAGKISTPTVVNIKASRITGIDAWFSSEESYMSSSGSGVIISPQGHIVTNHHVIEEGNTYSVTLNDKREYFAELVGKDLNTDLALLKINPEIPLPYIQIGNSDSLQVGEWVWQSEIHLTLNLQSPLALSVPKAEILTSSKGNTK